MNVLIVNGTEYRIYNHLYAVSRRGSVLRIKTMQPVEGKAMKTGYLYVGKSLIHRMVATCWIAPPKEGEEVHHINEIKSDNRDENLIWVSMKDHRTVYHESVGHYVRTETTRQKLRDYRTGLKSSEETKTKQREATLRLGLRPPNMKGHTFSAEVRAKRSVQHFRNTLCEVDGVRYRSFADAGRALNIRPLTLRKRCISDGFPNYKIVES